MLSRFITGNAGAVDESELQDKYGRLLAAGESFQAGFKVLRDTFIFTDKRLIIVDVQGLRGKKQEYHTIPYDKITKYSIESAGDFDLDAELKVWVGSETEPITKEFNKSVDIYDVQRVLATHTLK